MAVFIPAVAIPPGVPMGLVTPPTGVGEALLPLREEFEGDLPHPVSVLTTASLLIRGEAVVDTATPIAGSVAALGSAGVNGGGGGGGVKHMDFSTRGIKYPRYKDRAEALIE